MLKGALLFRLWFDLPQRPTRDIDFLGFGDTDPEQIKIIFTKLAEANMEDGLIFSADSITAEPIRKAAGLTESYANEKVQQWNAFLRRSQLEAPPLTEIVKELAAIYWPLLEKSHHY